MPDTNSNPLRGVFAAAVTPLAEDGQPDPDGFPLLLDHLAGRGCHGALLFGTTGEGPSFSVPERIAYLRQAVRYRDSVRPDFQILAGTGCTSLTDTITLTRQAFDLGVDGVVTLPAFYFKSASPAGLASYYEQVVRQAVPSEGRLLVYHIPHVAGVGVPAEALARLRELFPQQVAGMKDSSDDLGHLQGTLQAFPGLSVFVGSDSLMTDGLEAGAAGCITALANLISPINREVWDAHRAGQAAPAGQAKLTRARKIVKGLDGAAVIKSALADLFGLPRWGLRPPLLPLPPEQASRVAEELGALLAAESSAQA